VSRCVVLAKQHPMTQLSAPLLRHCRPSFSDQISVVDSCDGAAMFKFITISSTSQNTVAVTLRDNEELCGTL